MVATKSPIRTYKRKNIIPLMWMYNILILAERISKIHYLFMSLNINQMKNDKSDYDITMVIKI